MHPDGSVPRHGGTLLFRGKVLRAWAVVLLGALGLAVSAFVAADRSVSRELSRARAELAESTTAVAEQLRAIAASELSVESLSATGGALLDLQLAERLGVEGGIWTVQRGFVAYVFPTYDGSTPKTQLPAAELPRIRSLAEQALTEGRLVYDSVVGRREALIRTAQPLGAASPELVVWTMKRVPIVSARVLSNGALAASGLSLVIVAVGLWLTWFLSRWNKALHRMRAALAVRPVEQMPAVPVFGARELDDIGGAINSLSKDLRDVKAQAASLSRRLSSAERLAAVGRVSTALAHEIRNPLATIRLRAENALAHADPPSPGALQRILEEVERLERLVRSMLELGREIHIDVQRVDVREWIGKLVASAAPRAAAAGVRIESHVDVDSWEFDPLHLGRAVDSLLANAIQFAPQFAPIGSIITVHAQIDGDLVIKVEDQGDGIPEDIEARVFDPFFTTRPGGTGLGLALVREIVEAHGGAITVIHDRPGACLEMRIPCPASS